MITKDLRRRQRWEEKYVQMPDSGRKARTRMSALARVKFSLKIQIGKLTHNPELLLSYEGKTKVSKRAFEHKFKSNDDPFPKIEKALGGWTHSSFLTWLVPTDSNMPKAILKGDISF